MLPVAISGDERVFICGKTGSGKTFLAMHLLLPAPRLVVVDLKGTLGGWQLASVGREAERALRQGKPVRVRCRSVDEGTRYMGYAMDSGGCLIYIDEVYAFVGQGQRPPDELTAVWTRGREIGVGGWAATQRPTWLPLWLMSEADWYFCFRLTLEEDRKRMSAFMGEEVENPVRHKHGFYVAGADWDEPQYYSSFRSDIRLSALVERERI